jgi:hypothetical protein
MIDINPILASARAGSTVIVIQVPERRPRRRSRPRLAAQPAPARTETYGLPSLPSRPWISELQR